MTMLDSGLCFICALENAARPGFMPVERLDIKTRGFFEERIVGYNRLYAALGANEQIDLVIRMWRDPLARIGMYAVLSESENDGQYRITNIQHLLNDDGLKVMDLTLVRLEDFYDVEPAE